MMNIILLVAGITTLVGFWAYMLEVIQGRVGRYTTWCELSGYQFEIALMTIVGSITFIVTLIVAAIIKVSGV